MSALKAPVRRKIANTGATPATFTLPAPGRGFRIVILYINVEVEGGANTAWKLSVTNTTGTQFGRLIFGESGYTAGTAQHASLPLGTRGFPFGENVDAVFTLDAVGAGSLTIAVVFEIEAISAGIPPDPEL